MDDLKAWREAWPHALAAWSSYTQLRDPRFLSEPDELAEHGMDGQLAAIRIADQLVMINLPELRRRGLHVFPLAILAHEVGHHVYVPGNRTDHGRTIAAMAPMLEGLRPGTVHLVANLYADLLLNDRLQRGGVDVSAVYRRMQETSGPDEPGAVWRLYTRVYEHLWRQPARSLGPGVDGAEMDGDARLVAELVRALARTWLRGARRFAAILYPYLARDQEGDRDAFCERGLLDTKDACDGVPDGLTDIDPDELADGLDPGEPGRDRKGSGRSCRTPWEYGKLLETLGAKVTAREATARWYRERALPNLVPFPERPAPRAVEPLAEGYEGWAIGDELEALDVMGSVTLAPRMIPGVTTVRRVYGESPGEDPKKLPVDLDLYVDSSGSMPNPAVEVSYLALAGAILALSALRAGARVQATLWSGPGQIETTRGFVADEKRLLEVVTGSICGSTAFPVGLLRDTHAARKPSDPPVHVVVISDDGADTILAEGEGVVRDVLDKARGGGTMVLNMANYQRWAAADPLLEMGWRIHTVRDWAELVAFARAFARETWG
ncbi:MAG: VWA domain-containing protein [Myxococcota bacterium]